MLFLQLVVNLLSLLNKNENVVNFFKNFFVFVFKKTYVGRESMKQINKLLRELPENVNPRALQETPCPPYEQCIMKCMRIIHCPPLSIV